jgi:hypothetical protein
LIFVGSDAGVGRATWCHCCSLFYFVGLSIVLNITHHVLGSTPILAEGTLSPVLQFYCFELSTLLLRNPYDIYL